MVDLLAEIAQQLEQDSQAQRIRKLLFYVCHNQWLTDPAQIAATDLSRLVKLVQQFFPSLAILQEQLQQIVNQISKPAEYSQIADVIVTHFTPLYDQNHTQYNLRDHNLQDQSVTSPQLNDPTNFLSKTTAEKVLSPITLFQQQADIAKRLAAHPQADRLKKILYCLTHRKWESDRSQLEQADFTQLVDNLWRLYNTYDELQQTIENVVQRLTKPIEYGAIAAILLEETALLYGRTHKLTPLLTVLPATTEPTVPRCDPRFDIRQDLMKATNPLRLKILLVSLLDGLFDESDVAWNNLRKQSLDELVDRFINHSKSWSLLTLKLQDLVQQLSPSLEYEAVMEAFLKVIKPHCSDKRIQQGRDLEKIKPSSNIGESVDSSKLVAEKAG